MYFATLVSDKGNLINMFIVKTNKHEVDIGTRIYFSCLFDT